MRVLQRGHRYAIRTRKGKGTGYGDEAIVQYVNKEPGQEEDGTISQELIRVVIDRTHYCHNCLPHRVNEQIIWHLRMALALHESRALEQRTAKGLNIEAMQLDPLNGHLLLLEGNQGTLAETELKPVVFPPEQVCDYRSHE